MRRLDGFFGLRRDDEAWSKSYDANRNATQVGAKSFTYDSENHMMSMSTSGTSVSMIYDIDGNRVGKSVNGVLTYYLVDDLNPTGYPQVVEELSGAGVVTHQYTYGLQRISQSQFINGAWTPSFYGYDGGGNVRTLTNGVGAITDTYSYDAFGSQVSHTGSTLNNYLYRGEQYDSDLSLYYLRARYYNPLTGRFLSRDPDDHGQLDPNQLHKYLYADGDPANGVDPTGRGNLGLRLRGAALEYALVTTLVIQNVTRFILTYGPAVCKAVKWLSWGKTGAGVFQIPVPQILSGLIDAIRQYCSSIF